MAHEPHHAPRLPELPDRLPADHEVAAGAIAGLAGAAVMLLVAMVLSENGALFPLRLVAASLLGHEALDPAAVGPVLLGVGLGALCAVVLGLVFASILPRGLPALNAVGAGLAFGAVAWAVTWWGFIRILDPVLFAAAASSDALFLDLIFGAVAGLAMPPLRRVLP
ncbi:MAG: hypothetical protein HZB56_13455 [Deltaproteobacteria bacterium]|nr:hypothetical protein [Deltaproteobacteria bacterium]